MPTKIEWCLNPDGTPGETWNPVSGCRKITAGCKNCYAEAIAKRFWGDRKFTDVVFHPERLEAPLRWRKPRMVFVNSMSDLFHDDVADTHIATVINVIRDTPRHTYVVLTKRARNMLDWFRWAGLVESAPIPNLWLGVSVEDQATADERVPLLLQTPAAKRIVSYEPALGPIACWGNDTPEGILAWLTGAVETGMGSVCPDDAPKIDWLIAGAESGPGARPADVGWFKHAAGECKRAGVPFFLKQMRVDGKLVKMPRLDRRLWDQVPPRGEA